MIGKILSFYFFDTRSSDFLKILHNVGGGNTFEKHVVTFSEKKSILREIGNFGINLVQK